MGWACRDELDEYGFYEDRSCGQEGLRGPLDRQTNKAEDALAAAPHVTWVWCAAMMCLRASSVSSRDSARATEREIFKK